MGVSARSVVRDPVAAVMAQLPGNDGAMLDAARRLGGEVKVTQFDLGYQKRDFSDVHVIGIGLRFSGEDHLLWKFEAHAARAILFALSQAFGGAEVVRGSDD